MAQIKNLTDFLQFMKDNITGIFHDDVKTLRNKLGSNLLIYYNGSDTTRIILVADKMKTKSLLWSQCNGLVIKYPECEVISMPSRKYEERRAVNNLSDYDIYKIRDGTVVTLYWFNNNWIMSTTKGLDVREHMWTGPLSYGNVFLEAINGKFTFDQLDRELSYTFGFRHKNFHPLDDVAADSLWFIQASRAENIICKGGHKEDDCEICKFCTQCNIPQQEILTITNPKEIANHCENSLTNYTINNIAHYGFILRSKNPENIDLIIRSKLLHEIRNMIYEMPQRRDPNATAITAENRIEYCALRAYLSVNQSAMFNMLFPQYEHFSTKFATLFTTLQNRIIATMRGHTKNTIKGDTNIIIDALAQVFVKHFEDLKLSPMHQNCQKIIQDFIRDKQHLELHFAYFSKLTL